MSLQRLTLDCMPYFAIGFLLLGTIEYSQAPFAVTKVFPYWVQLNTSSPSFTLLPCRYSHIRPAHPTR
jgi:hypothetical protein